MNWAAGAIGGTFGILGNLYSQSEQEKAAYRNADLVYGSSMEELRRYEIQAEKNLEQTRNNIYASGVTFSGSAARSFKELQAEQDYQADYMAKNAKQVRSATRQAAQVDPVQTILSGVGGFVGGLF